MATLQERMAQMEETARKVQEKRQMIERAQARQAAINEKLNDPVNVLKSAVTLRRALGDRKFEETVNAVFDGIVGTVEAYWESVEDGQRKLTDSERDSYALEFAQQELTKLEKCAKSVLSELDPAYVWIVGNEQIDGLTAKTLAAVFDALGLKDENSEKEQLSKLAELERILQDEQARLDALLANC